MRITNNQISITDFTGTYQLGITGNSHYVTNLNEIIAEKQPGILKKFLGDAEYVKFIADLDGNGNPETQKWIDFINGTTLTNVDGSRTLVYTGFKEILKRHIYCWYLTTFHQLNTNIGNVEKKTQNSKVLTPINKISRAWNDGIELRGKDWSNLFIDNHDYRHYVNYCEYEKYLNTAYNYCYWMNDSDSSSFPDWEFYPEKTRNSMGI